MPTTIAIRFVLGRYHATPWATHVNEGQVELPPSPWRLLRALYATWKDRRPDLEGVQALLARLATPPIYRVPEHVLAHTRHYYPDLVSTTTSRSTDQTFDAFAAIDPTTPLLVTWPLDLTSDERHVLDTLCAAMPYLGRADSICQAELITHHLQTPSGPQPQHRKTPEHQWVPHEHPDLTDTTVHETRPLLAPQTPLDLDALIARPIDWRRKGLLYPEHAHLLAYHRITPAPDQTSSTTPPSPTIPAPPAPAKDPRTPTRPARRPHKNLPTTVDPSLTVVRFDVGLPARPSYLDTVPVTDSLHLAAASRMPDHQIRQALSNLLGRDKDNQPLRGPHTHAHLLTIPDHHQRIAQIIVWSPAGLAPDEIDALTSIHQITNHKIPRLRRPTHLLATAVGGNDLLPASWTAPSQHWRSFTPYVPTGHSKNNPNRHALRRIAIDLTYTNPDIAQALATTDIIPTGHPSHSPISGIFERRHIRKNTPIPHAPAHHMLLTFKRPIAPTDNGLLTAGQLTHYGLGLFQPAAP